MTASFRLSIWLHSFDESPRNPSNHDSLSRGAAVNTGVLAGRCPNREDPESTDSAVHLSAHESKPRPFAGVSKSSSRTGVLGQARWRAHDFPRPWFPGRRSLCIISEFACAQAPSQTWRPLAPTRPQRRPAKICSMAPPQNTARSLPEPPLSDFLRSDN